MKKLFLLTYWHNKESSTTIIEIIRIFLDNYSMILRNCGNDITSENSWPLCIIR